MTLDFKTERQKQREELHKKIANLYVQIRRTVEVQSIKVSDYQIFLKIANEFRMTQSAVRTICIAQGVAAPKRM